MEKVNSSFKTDSGSKLNKNTFAQWFKTHPRAAAGALYGGVALFILAVFAVMLYHYGIYPFGDYSMSSYDMNAQVAPFLEHFYDVIDGKSSLFYSYAIAGGADVFGTLAYCCISPFTFLFLFFGRGEVYYGTSIVLPLKVACVAISGLYYIRKRFGNIHPSMQALLALSYAFCGYLFVSNTYINWVDLLIYLPIAALGFYKLVNTGKKGTFIVGLALMIYACFSISCFSLFTVFPIIVGYCLFVVEKDKRKKVLSDAVWGVFLAIVAALPLLVPALRAFLVSGRKTGLFDNLDAQYSYEALYKKASYLFSDSFTLFFTLAYFVKNGLKSKKSKFLALTAVILILPVIVDESMNLLNFGSYMSYSLRFGFLNGFYFFYVACLFVQEYTEDLKERKVYFEKRNLVANKKIVLLFFALMCLLVIALSVGLVFFNKSLENNTFVSSFAGRFAHSLGGLEVTAIVFGCVALIALFGGLLVYCNKFSVKLLVPILIITLCSQTVFYSANLVRGNRSSTPTTFTEMKVLTDAVEEYEGNKDTRVKMFGDYLTACMPFTLHTNAFSVFSSVIDSRNFLPTSFFKFGGNGMNSMKTYNGVYLGDVIFGNKYMISDKERYSSYLEERTIIDENGAQIVTKEWGKSGKYILYKNKYALPHAFAVNSATSDYKAGTLVGDYDAILKMFYGESGGVEILSPKITLQQDGTYRVATPISGPANYFISMNFKNPERVRYMRATYNEEDSKPLIGNEDVSLGYSESNSGTYSVYLKISDPTIGEEEIRSACTSFRVSLEQIEKIHAFATAQKVEFSTAPDLLKVKITATKGQNLFLNYVALPGHVAIVNGQERELKQNTLGFMLVELDEGENNVEIIYKSPYKAFIGIGLALACFIFLVYLLLKKKAVKVFEYLQAPLYWMAIGLTVALLLFFFVMPTGVCAVKNIKLLAVKIGDLFKGLF